MRIFLCFGFFEKIPQMRLCDKYLHWKQIIWPIIEYFLLSYMIVEDWNPSRHYFSPFFSFKTILFISADTLLGLCCIIYCRFTNKPQGLKHFTDSLQFITTHSQKNPTTSKYLNNSLQLYKQLPSKKPWNNCFHIFGTFNTSKFYLVS